MIKIPRSKAGYKIPQKLQQNQASNNNQSLHPQPLDWFPILYPTNCLKSKSLDPITRLDCSDKNS